MLSPSPSRSPAWFPFLSPSRLPPSFRSFSLLRPAFFLLSTYTTPLLVSVLLSPSIPSSLPPFSLPPPLPLTLSLPHLFISLLPPPSSLLTSLPLPVSLPPPPLYPLPFPSLTLSPLPCSFTSLTSFLHQYLGHDLFAQLHVGPWGHIIHQLALSRMTLSTQQENST